MKPSNYCKLTECEQSNVDYLFRRQVLAKFSQLSDREFFDLFSDHCLDFAILVDDIVTQLLCQRELF